MLYFKKTMIYLIGGSPRSGKSLLSKRLSKSLKIPQISTDTMRSIVLPYFKDKNKKNNFPFETMFNSSNVDEYFEKYSGQDMLKAEITEAKALWSGIKSMVRHLDVCKMDYIIEGVHLFPCLLKEFKNNKNIKIIYLTKINEKKIYKGLLQNNGGDWILDNIKKEQSIILASKALSEYGHYFMREAKKFKFTCINTEDNFLKEVNNLKNKYGKE